MNYRATVNAICKAAGMPTYSKDEYDHTYYILRENYAFWALQYHPDITTEALYLTIARKPGSPTLDGEFLLDLFRTTLKLGFKVLVAETTVPSVRRMLKRIGFETIGTHDDKTNHILFLYKLPDKYLKRLSNEGPQSSSSTTSARPD